jgi:hypothetical protein
MIQPLELHEMNLLELYEKLRMSDNDFERWMTNLGLLHSSMLCDNCQQPMIDKCKEETAVGFTPSFRLMESVLWNCPTSYVASAPSSPLCAPLCRSRHTLSYTEY